MPRRALLVALLLLASFLSTTAAHADCSALVPPTRDTCLRVELGLAEAAARAASDTLLARLDPPARPALQAEQRWIEPEFRSCRALSQIRRGYKQDETRRAAICIADMQDQASGRLEWLTALELGRPQSGIHAPRAGLRPADYQLVARHSGKCVDVSGISTAARALIHQWTCNPAGQGSPLNQTWRVMGR